MNTIDIERLARRARIAAELGRLRSAVRVPLLIIPFTVFLATTAPATDHCVRCFTLGALTFVLGTFFRWRNRAEGQAATLGLASGILALSCALTIRLVSPGWQCVANVPNAGPAALVVAVVLFLILSREYPRGAGKIPFRGLMIAGLLSGVSTSIACVGGGIAALSLSLAGATLGAAAGLVTARFSTD
jgi:hypothetical protein